MKDAASMDKFAPYLDYLNSLILESVDSSENDDIIARIDDALDGQPAQELRRLVSLTELRTSGAFFTGSKLSQFAVKSFADTIDDESVILDPACGTGDLLIACATRLGKNNDLDTTLKSWGTQIMGRDIYPEFIQAAKARLLLSALRNNIMHERNIPRIQETFPKIDSGCGMTDDDALKSATHIVVNPPFGLVDAPQGCDWTSGKVNAAALFMEAFIVQANLGTRIVAILPDVLRSGSRYEKWRRFIESRSRIHRIELHGRFDRWTDVDVFVLDVEIQEESTASKGFHWNKPDRSTPDSVGEWFDVRIGPVVDYRDPREGPSHPFVHARNSSPWQTVSEVSQFRRFKGKVITSPFVVVRRTSRPGDKYRALGTIINSEKPVAVENHLLVLCPKDGTIESCRELLKVLRNPQTTQWLDQYICCRHLTVSAIADLPWWRDAE